MDRSLLDFERLDVYRCAMDFMALAVKITDGMPRGHAEVRDQLRRASASIPLNIAEATGKVSPAERAHHHVIARGSAFECAAALDVLRAQRAVAESDVAAGKLLLSRIVSMLTKMSR